jgi:polysaccharide biosynthesis protein PslH
MKLLVLLSRVPYPLEKGDKLRAFHQIKYLAEKFDLHLCCLNDAGDIPGAEESLKPYCKSLHIINLSKITIYWNVLKSFLTAKPLQVGYFYSCKAKRKINNLIKEIAPDHIFCQLLRVAEYVKELDIPKTIDYQDVFSKGYERQASSVSWILKPIFKREARLLKLYESRIFDWFDQHCIISQPDRSEIDHPDRDSIRIVHNGVDLDYFKPIESIKNIDILFTGNMNYPPNVSGVEFLIHEVLPILNKLKPSLKVMIAGVNPSRKVLSLASGQVEVTGWVNDIRDAYNRSRLFVAPMMIGTGLQNKLLEAMAMKLPCITSPLANAALEALPGEQILICESAEEYVKEIIMLLENNDIVERIASNGQDFARNNYNWQRETEKLAELIEKGKSPEKN